MLRLSLFISAALLSAGAAASASSATSIPSATKAGDSSPSLDYTLHLGGLRFDPLLDPPPARQNAAMGPDLHLLQLDGPISRQWLSGLRDSGMELMQYIHPYSYVVWADEQALTQVAAREGVRWSGHFATEFRVIPEQRGFDSSLRASMALISRHADEAELHAAMSAIGADIHSISPLNRHFSVVHMDLPGDRYLELAALRGVYTLQDIPQDGGPRGEMSNQAVVGGYGPPPSNAIVPGYESWLVDSGYDGSGVIVGIVDGGINTAHQDLVGQISPCVSAGGSPTTCTTNNNSHGSHVAGAVAGTGASGAMLNGFLRGQGVAPGAKVIQQRYGAFLGGAGSVGGMIPNGMLTIYKESALSNAVLTNNSWGPGSTPRGYDIPTQQIDFISRDANPDEPGSQPVLAVWSIMNGNGDSFGACSPSSLGSPDEAKNLFAVGSTRLQSGTGTQNSAIFDISGNSAHGNACDGRRVPHIVAPGCSTDSTSSGAANSYGFACGTSMASPVVSGAVALYVEKHREQNDGATPSPALVKAVFTAAAQNLQGFRNANNNVMGHRPDRFQGYGRLDLDKVINPGVPVFTLDQTVLFNNSGEEWTRSFSVADPDQPVLIMLSWSDAPGHGLGGTTPAWVNDLDLRVDSNGDSYLGNVIGGDGWSSTGGNADGMNNLEGVFLSPAQHGGSVDISVIASNIAADALDPWQPGDPAQDFALVCYNCATEGEPPVVEVDLALSLFAFPGVVEVGDELTLVAQIANFGENTASGVLVEMQVPSDLSFQELRTVDLDSGEVTSGSAWTCQHQGGLTSCELPGDLAAGTLAPTLGVVLRVANDAASGIIEINASVASDQTEVSPGNNQMSINAEIINSFDPIFANGFE